MRNRAPFITCLLAFAFLGACVLGCSSGGGGGGRTCTAILTRAGQTFTGEANVEAEAKHNACNKYCRAADPGYDARYRIWLDSPSGKAAGSPSKEEAIYKDKDLMNYVTVTCSNQCVQEAESGANKIEVNCK